MCAQAEDDDTIVFAYGSRHNRLGKSYENTGNVFIGSVTYGTNAPATIATSAIQSGRT